MKSIIRWFILASLIVVSSLGLLFWNQPGAAAQAHPAFLAETSLSQVENPLPRPDFEEKIDLNNANIIAFKDCQGFYPSLAMLVIKNSPYQKVEDVLTIAGLSDSQKELLTGQLKNFTITEPKVPLEMRMPPRPVLRK